MKNKIFYEGSRTYYYASRFFPKKLREEITTLYAFVRCVDDFVDATPPKKKEFDEWNHLWQQAWNGEQISNSVINDFIILAKEKDFDKKWIEGFMASMQFDVEKNRCESIKESIWYMYGSAEVIGLMMAKIMHLPEQSYEKAALLGRAMQYINFIRDIDEDNKLRKKYIIQNTTPRSNDDKEKFCIEIQKEIERYEQWNTEAKKGFSFIPYRPLVAIMTATEMYEWTALQIKKDPLIVFKKKIKPTKTRIIVTGIKNMVKAAWT